MNATTFEPLRPVHLPVDLLNLEAQTREIYLSEDLTAICEISRASNILISAAALPLEARKRAFSEWRAGIVRQIWTRCPALQTAPPELGFAGKLQDPSFTLMDVDGLLHLHQAEAAAHAAHLRVCAKAALKNAVRLHWEDWNPTRIFPKALAIRGSGEMRLFSNLQAAKTWGITGASGFHLVSLADDRREFFPS